MGKPGIEGDQGKHGEKVPYDSTLPFISVVSSSVFIGISLRLGHCMKILNWSIEMLSRE
jgi:hypothetical protein